MTTPQIPFITAPFKKTDDVDWIHPLKKYIARFYQDDPEKYKEETQSFNRLRQDIRGAGKDITGRDLLYRYFGQLELLDLRFPVDEKHVKVLFNWYDAFNNRAVAQYSLAFEKASIIFNEASTLSAIASAQNRAEAEGRKRAFHYFQASAGMFQYINDNFLHAPSEDLSRETVQMLCELMLAQAHECFLESSIREKKKEGLIAKLASHAAWAYGHLVDAVNDAIQRGVGVDKSYDAFNNRAVAQYSLAFEKASIIFNEAATLSAIASAQNRAEAEGRKRAFHYFQASAGMFQYINDNFLHAPSEDLSRETVQMLCELMLAQAHECFLESSIREKKKEGLIAKLASHAAWTYGHLVDAVNDAIQRGVGVDKSWATICQIKQKYYAATAQQHKAAACETEAKYGECVARYSAAESAAKEAVKLSNSLPSLLLISNHANGTVPSECANALQELCKTLSATCTEKVTSATRDNDMIYHDAVPQESILTPIDRLKAVKTIPISELYGPDEIKKVIGVDLFSKLIPISIHESASLYSEEKAKLLRSENERCDLAKAELNTSLDYMKLPGSLAKFKQQTLDVYASPPTEVKQWADQVVLEERTKSIGELLNTLNSAKLEARQILDEINLSLDTEMRDCEQERVKHGDLWTQAPSASLTTEFRHDILNHRRMLENANQSDQQLFAKYSSVQHHLDILKQPQALEKAFTDTIINLSNKSNVTSDMSLLDVDTGVEDNKNKLNEKVQRVESILEKLRKIESDRNETFQDLKEKVNHFYAKIQKSHILL
ncbi:Putative Vacuolar protein-sorting protein bro1 (Fragment) [Rhizopus microsporus]